MLSDVQMSSFESISEHLYAIETDTLLIIADQKVWDLYSNRFEIQNKQVWVWSECTGEAFKTYKNFEKCLEFFLSKNIHRKVHLVTLGGGATSDFGGYIAASLLRGIKWTCIPTSLLAMVDAGIGGKVGINSSYGKNLVGAFYAPQNVLICSEFLETLPQKELDSGKGEILKYALLDKTIMQLVLEHKPIHDLIQKCADYKSMIVDKDFKEGSLRAILNLGHTFGHAFEYEFKLPHGVAVVLGCLFLDEFLCEKAVRESLLKLIECLKIELPKKLELIPSNLLDYLKKDKKKADNQHIHMILLRKPGIHSIEKIAIEKLEAILKPLEGQIWKPLK